MNLEVTDAQFSQLGDVYRDGVCPDHGDPVTTEFLDRMRKIFGGKIDEVWAAEMRGESCQLVRVKAVRAKPKMSESMRLRLAAQGS